MLIFYITNNNNLIVWNQFCWDCEGSWDFYVIKFQQINWWWSMASKFWGKNCPLNIFAQILKVAKNLKILNGQLLKCSRKCQLQMISIQRSQLFVYVVSNPTSFNFLCNLFQTLLLYSVTVFIVFFSINPIPFIRDKKY
jgi:hypothetical protein